MWQAVCILLPVVVIAAIALSAIIQNRAAVERDARRRAEELARQYATSLERPWGALLSRFERFSHVWLQHEEDVAGAWPGSHRTQAFDNQAVADPAQRYNSQLAEWQTEFPGLQPDEVFPCSFLLTPEGHFAGALDFNPAPQPPPWFTRLSTEQRAEWAALQSGDSAAQDPSAFPEQVARFLDLAPSPPAITNAMFLALRAQLASMPPADAVTQALQFAESSRDILSDTGLPLPNLAYAEALRYSLKTGPTEALWNEIPDQVWRAPSPLVPSLLDKLAQVAALNPQSALPAGVEAWKRLWLANARMHELAAQLSQSGRLNTRSPASFWIEQAGMLWLCSLRPPEMPAAVEPGQPAPPPQITVRALPQSALERSLGRALANVDVKLPGYLGVAVWLEGQPLGRTADSGVSASAIDSRMIFAEAGGSLPFTGTELSTAGGVPGRPRFVVQLYLADSQVLYAAYRRHALLMGGLVAAASLAALLGVLASWRGLQRQLRLNELKSNFVSSVSHELRAPIASVRLMAESLERGKVGDAARQQEYYHFMVQECRRLSSLIENVLDYSRIEQGRKQYELEPTDLPELVRQTVTLLQNYAAEKQVKLELLPAPAALATIQPRADGKAVQQALVNLIDNAIKHSAAGQTVTVGLQTSSTSTDRIQLFVQDHGPGIPSEEHEKIFERFYRRGSELRRETQGVGIGLSIVKHIVEAHAGRVLVESAPGKGSRFTIELPITPKEAKA